MPTIRLAMQRFRAYLRRRNYAAHTVDSYLTWIDSLTSSMRKA
jgi:hypothetical protein